MDPHQIKIITAARELGIQTELLEEKWGIDIVRLTHKGRSTLVTLGRVFTHLNAVADQIAASKVASKALMKELGIPVPAELILDPAAPDQTAITSFMKQYNPVVAKPLAGTDGMGIAMHLTSAETVIQHITTFIDDREAGRMSDDNRWLLEEQVQGEDLRLQYLSGKLIAACIRRPCTLVGNGSSTVAELIEARNAVTRAQNPLNHVNIDHQVTNRLSAAGLTMASVLPEGRLLQIKDVSNMAQGGHAIDVTDRVHPKYGEYLDRLAKALNLRLFSLDVMATSPEADPDTHAHVLEFNAQPAWLHHTFSEVRTHDIPTLILKDYFDIP